MFIQAYTARGMLILTLVATLLGSGPIAVAQEKQPGLWEPPPPQVRQTVESLSGLTIRDLRNMRDDHLIELLDYARSSVELIAIEMKRRAHRTSRLEKPRSSSGQWRVDDGQLRVDDGYVESGLTYGGTRP